MELVQSLEFYTTLETLRYFEPVLVELLSSYCRVIVDCRIIYAWYFGSKAPNKFKQLDLELHQLQIAGKALIRISPGFRRFQDMLQTVSYGFREKS